MPSISIPTPIDSLTVDERDGAIVQVRWPMTARAETPLLREARRQLDAYFAGRLSRFDLPLAGRGPNSTGASEPRCRPSPTRDAHLWRTRARHRFGPGRSAAPAAATRSRSSCRATACWRRAVLRLQRGAGLPTNSGCSGSKQRCAKRLNGPPRQRYRRIIRFRGD